MNRDSQLFENDITYEMFVKTRSIIVMGLSGTQDMIIFRPGTLRLECTFAVPL